SRVGKLRVVHPTNAPCGHPARRVENREAFSTMGMQALPVDAGASRLIPTRSVERSLVDKLRVVHPTNAPCGHPARGVENREAFSAMGLQALPIDAGVSRLIPTRSVERS